MKKNIKSGSDKLGLAGAVAATIAASVCCVGPIVLMGLGVSGAWIGSLSAFTPYRPVFMAVAFGLLGLAFYKTYTKPKPEECSPDSYCANPKSRRVEKAMLFVFSALIVGLLAFPYAAGYVFAENVKPQVKAAKVIPRVKTTQAILEVSNLTCVSCAIPVRRSLEKLDGVESAKVTMNPPQAIVLYDPARITPDELTVATTKAGYPSSVEKREMASR
ncbi:hypothetical protein MNBD_NITROSPINAE02-517 [hydrothermal vent metagenome]|uniref:HMA domain-containing protein n=1 Tax=hydrothermal vent metagenome TaxID=652676 RepID=A0A3B1BI97_9ZZZZ